MTPRRPDPAPRSEHVRERSRLALAWYELVRLVTLLCAGLTGGIRATGRENLPRDGGALLVSNHLSYLDVFLLGLGVPRPLSYVARASLFVGPLAPLIRSVGGFPIDRDRSGAGGLKETLRRLKGGSMVLIFPEGTRSRDGAIGPLKPGIAALGRARVPIIPAAIAGTFEAWPAGRRLPRPHAVRVHYGEPIPPETVAALTPDELTALIAERIRESQRVARRGLVRDTGGSFGVIDREADFR
jgi:1-acyl-sn-glycerol-3-phosphate acyltransferase